MFARADRAGEQPIQVFVAECDGQAYTGIAPGSLSFNSAEGTTLGPVVDPSRPNEMLVSGAARAPAAGKLDIYRTLAPSRRGKAGCLPGHESPP